MTENKLYPWVVPGKVFTSVNFFDEDTLENRSELEEQMLGKVRSKFDKHNIYGYFTNEGKNIFAIAMHKNGVLSIPEHNVIMNVPRGTFIAFYDNIECNILETSEYLEKHFSYVDKAGILGSGSKAFEVVATIRDEYRLKVMASSEDEALQIANAHDISEWEHPDIEPHLSDRRIIRHARWGNLSVREIE
jgi:hypothetical protein